MLAASSSARSFSQPRQVNLRFGVAEAGVELEHLRPGLGQHDARIQDAMEINALSRAAAQPRGQDAVADGGQLGVAQERGGGIGAHAAGVQAEVAVQRPLVVLGGREQLGGLAVAEGVEGDFHAGRAVPG